MASLYPYPWRTRLKPASFRGAEFHVEHDGQSSGRRIALHEYPKKNSPYAEDMGKRARRHNIQGYIIMSSDNGHDYTPGRDALIKALEADGPAMLIHPSLEPMQVMADTYSVEEERERGGICVFRMLFVEAGSATDFGATSQDTQGNVNGAANNAEQGVLDSGTMKTGAGLY